MAALSGNLTLAQQQAPLALETARHIGNPATLELALYAFGLASWESNPTAARAALEENIQIARSSGYDRTLARVLALLAQLQARGGDLSAALGTLKEGLENAHINDDRPGIAICLAGGAAVLVALGEHQTAAVFLGAATDRIPTRLNPMGPIEISAYNEFITKLRSQLGQDRYTAATDRGAAMTYEQASAFALAAVKGLRPAE
jgi:hypothetical protein